MFKASRERMVDAFALQFESDGGQGYFYRHAGYGAGIPVSTAERKAFINIYRLESRWLMPGVAIGTGVSILASAFIGDAFGLRDDIPRHISLAGGLAIVVVPILVASKRIYNAPRRALAHREAVGPERSREEAKAIWVANQSWGQTLIPLASLLGACAMQATRQDVLHGWGRLWSLLLAVGTVTFAYATIRKWRNQIG